MADNNANHDVGSNVDIAGDQPSGREDDQTTEAILNEKDILTLARLLRTLGDLDVEIGQRFNGESEEDLAEESFFSGLKIVLETVDRALEWLELSAKKDTEEVDGQPQPQSNEHEKKGQVLWMLYHITALGSHILLASLLEISSKFLDLPENRYKAKTKHVKVCLKEVENHRQELFELVQRACNILQEIIREAQFRQEKALEFEVIVHQAEEIIKTCKRYLSSAEETIGELMKVVSNIKVLSRILQFAGFCVTCYGLYHMVPSSSTVDKLAGYVPPTTLSLVRKVACSPVKHVGFATLCAFSGYAWLSFFPSRAYAFRDDLTDLQQEHKRLTEGLCHLEQRMKTMVSDMDGIKTKMSLQKEGSV